MDKITPLMKLKIKETVLGERRPFCVFDFREFEVGGKKCSMTDGTFRNNVSKLSKSGYIEKAFKSKPQFYTIPGHRFDRSMTLDHTGGTLSSTSICSPQELRCIKNHPVYRLIQNVPYDKSALHDIRLITSANGIWHILSCMPSKSMNQNSKDILVIKEEINHLNIRVAVHHSDTISVVIGCSFSPVAVDIDGIIRLSNALTLVHDRLQRLIKDCNSSTLESLR